MLGSFFRLGDFRCNGRIRFRRGNRNGGRLFRARRQCILRGMLGFFLWRGRTANGPAGHTRLDGALHLPQDDACALADGVAQGQDGIAGVELADALEVLRGEVAVQVEATAGQQQEGQADGGGVPEAQGHVVLVQPVQGAVTDGEHDIVFEVVPVFIREPDSQGDELLVQAVVAGDLEALGQPGCDGWLVLVPVLPEHGVPAVLPALRVGHVEHVAEEDSSIAVAEQGDALGAAPDASAHAAGPEVELGAGGGGGALGVDHDLVQKVIFVKLARREQKLGPVYDLGGQVRRGMVRHLAIGIGFRGHQSQPPFLDLLILPAPTGRCEPGIHVIEGIFRDEQAIA